MAEMKQSFKIMPIAACGRFDAMTKILKTTTVSVENKEITERKRGGGFTTTGTCHVEFHYGLEPLRDSNL